MTPQMKAFLNELADLMDKYNASLWPESDDSIYEFLKVGIFNGEDIEIFDLRAETVSGLSDNIIKSEYLRKLSVIGGIYQ